MEQETNTSHSSKEDASALELSDQEVDEEVDDLVRQIFGGDDDDDSNSQERMEDPVTPQIPDKPEYSEEFHHLRDRRFVVGERELLLLLKKSVCEVCDGRIKEDTMVEGEYIAAGVKYTFSCINGHKGKWISTSFYGGKSVAALLLQLMVLISGLSWEMFSLGASFINLFTGGSRSFYYHQLSYRVAIATFFRSHFENTYSTLLGRPISLSVDVRYDSPGFSANKATGIFMDTDTRYIVGLDVAYSREVGRVSQRMEKVIVQRGLLQFVTESRLAVWEVVSDASRTIISLLKTEPVEHLTHSLDIWHKAKKLTLRLSEIAKRAPCRSLLSWIRPITNHFWYCSSACKGDPDKMVERWCRHEPNASPEGKQWLSKDSVTYKELRKIVLDKSWTGSFPYYASCRQTWGIKNFNSHTLLHYCPKTVSFSFDSYVIRNQLAVMDHNHHLKRPVQETSDGQPCSMGQFSRKTKTWVAFEKKGKKDYSYVPELIAACLHETYGKRKENLTRSERAKALDEIAGNLSGGPAPPARSLLTEMKSRKEHGAALTAKI